MKEETKCKDCNDTGFIQKGHSTTLGGRCTHCSRKVKKEGGWICPAKYQCKCSR